MAVLNELDRFHLVGDVIDQVPSLGSRPAYAKQFLRDKLLDHKNYIHKHGQDMPEIRNWKWHCRSFFLCPKESGNIDYQEPG